MRGGVGVVWKRERERGGVCWSLVFGDRMKNKTIFVDYR